MTMNQKALCTFMCVYLKESYECMMKYIVHCDVIESTTACKCSPPNVNLLL